MHIYIIFIFIFLFLTLHTHVVGLDRCNCTINYINYSMHDGLQTRVPCLVLMRLLTGPNDKCFLSGSCWAVDICSLVVLFHQNSNWSFSICIKGQLRQLYGVSLARKSPIITVNYFLNFLCLFIIKKVDQWKIFSGQF